MERKRNEIDRLKVILRLQDLLAGVSESRKDFLNGTNGALVSHRVPSESASHTLSLQTLSQEQLDSIAELHKAITPDRTAGEEYPKQLETAAERLFALSQYKDREAVKGTTYRQIRETLDAVGQCDYFEKRKKSPKKRNSTNAPQQPPAPTEQAEIKPHHQPATTVEQPIPPAEHLSVVNQQQQPQHVQFLQDSTLPQDPAIVSMQLNQPLYPNVPAYSDASDMQLTGQKFVDAPLIPTQTFTNAQFAGGYPASYIHNGHHAPVSIAPIVAPVLHPTPISHHLPSSQAQDHAVSIDARSFKQQPQQNSEYAANMEHLRKSSQGADENTNFTNNNNNRGGYYRKRGGYRGGGGNRQATNGSKGVAGANNGAETAPQQMNGYQSRRGDGRKPTPRSGEGVRTQAKFENKQQQ